VIYALRRICLNQIKECAAKYLEFSSAAVLSVVGNNEDVLNFFDLKFRTVVN